MRTTRQFSPAFEPNGPRPLWLSPNPVGLCFYAKNKAFTLDPVSFRDSRGLVWTVPKGFLTDGMSYPWPLSRFWNKFDPRTLRTAIVHDFRYTMHDYFEDWGVYDNRTDADTGLLEGLCLDCPSRAFVCYLGVRFGGNHIYEQETREAGMIDWIASVRNGTLDSYVKRLCQGADPRAGGNA